MSHSPQPDRSDFANAHRSHQAYLEDMDYYDERPGWGSGLFPWIAGLGICLASAGVGVAFSWMMSPTQTASNRDNETLQANTAGSNSTVGEPEESDPLGIPLEELALIPVDPLANSQVRPSRLPGSVSEPSNWAANPALRRRNDSLEEGDDAQQNQESERSSNEIVETEQVETRNVGATTTSNPRLDLGPDLGEGTFLVLMTYQGDNSLSEAREHSQGAFIKRLEGETYVQLAAFDQLEYARHMADRLRRQGVSVLILQ